MDEQPLPIFFYANGLLIGALIWFSWSKRRCGWGLPAVAVYATIGIWYLGDAFYNDYSDYANKIGPSAIMLAWVQVSIFLVALAAFAEPVSHQIAGHRGRSYVVEILERRPLESPLIQHQLDLLCKPLATVWIILMLIALYRVNFDFIGLFTPYFGTKAQPWGRQRLGGGFDALIATAGYIQIFLTSIFGIIAALARNPRTRMIATGIFVLSAPYFLIDRTRNTMLAIVVPTMIAWTFGRFRGSFPIKVVVLVSFAALINFWLAFIISNRDNTSIASAFTQDSSFENLKEKRHHGINMFEELAWISVLISEGRYKPNVGGRYFAEIVNPIPRVLWPGKPLIGIDYAIARGQGGGSASQAGVYTSVSTGIIGQGVVNFGPFLGPVFAAFLMSIWIGILAKLDFTGHSVGRLLLYLIGMVLTFNLGRDITLITLYPLIFGWLIVRSWEKKHLFSFNPVRGNA